MAREREEFNHEATKSTKIFKEEQRKMIEPQTLALASRASGSQR
jgi:hypothetical protein